MKALHITLNTATHYNREMYGNKFGALIEVSGKINRDDAVFRVTFWKDRPGQISVEASIVIPREPNRFGCVDLSVRDRQALIDFARLAIAA